MPDDHSPRPVRSFLSFLGFERRSSPSRHPHSSSPRNDSPVTFTPRYGPDRPTSVPPSRSPSQGHVPPTGTHLSSDGSSLDTPVADDVTTMSPNIYVNQQQSSQFINQIPLLPFSAPQSLQPSNSTLSLATPLYTSSSVRPQSASIYQAPSDSINPNHSTSAQCQPPYPTYHPTPRPPSAMSDQIYQPLNQRPTSKQPDSHGMFNKAHDFTLTGAVFIDNNASNFTLNMGDNNFMASLLKETIIGAEFDSSDPNMPLRCHPGTRLEIIRRCQDFILNRQSRPKLRWVVGAAGVGKSAIMQSVVQDESGVLSDVIVGATIFFSVNGRQDGAKAITTIAYQLAVKLDSYRLFVQREVTRDPSLFRKSLSRQFHVFIVEPFIQQRILDCSSRLLIIIDGLDECANPLTQQEILGLVSDFCISYPTSPIVWIIASRPEPHITSFFLQPKVALSYEKEEILVDSDDAHEDVKRYLRDKLREVQMASITLQRLSQWPSDGDFSKIAEASGGLFAYASTVVRYISDPTYGDPVGQLDDVLNMIEAGPNSSAFGQDHPMAQLDALYAHIMSKIPAKVIGNTRKILLLYVWGSGRVPFQFNCNMLEMTESAAYGATHHIRSIAIVPGPAEATNDHLTFFHKSFPDYIRDFKRSGFSPDIVSEAEQLIGECGLRILKEAPNGVPMGGAGPLGLNLGGGTLKNDPKARGSISLSWPAAGEHGNREMRQDMFRRAVWEGMEGLRRGEEAFRSLFCMRVLTTCFTKLPRNFPFDAMRDSAFHESRRRELSEHGILKEVPGDKLDYDAVPRFSFVQLRFRSFGESNPYHVSCQHEREGKWESRNQDWTTTFVRPGGHGSLVACDHCFQRFAQHFKTQLRRSRATVLQFTPAYSLVELRFVDPEDGISQWTYVFEYGDRWGVALVE